MVHCTLLLCVFLAVFAGNIAVRLILNRMNISHLRTFGHKVPKPFADLVDQQTLTRMRDYTVATSRVDSVENLAGDLIVLAILLSGFLPWLNGLISALDLHVVVSGILFFFSCSLIMGMADIPFDLYRNFVIEKRFSFNTLTFRLWLADLIKSLLISAVVMGVFLAVLLSLVYHAPASWWIWAWLFFIFFQLLIMWLYPVVISPLFNTFEPIEDSELKDRVLLLADRTGIDVKGLYKMDAGKRSRHSNAYFTGIGKAKRIVLFDTLVEAHNTDEISAVLAHELGHWKKGHIKKQLAASMVLSLGVLYLAYAFSKHDLLYATFGFDGITIYAGLFLLAVIARPFFFFLTPVGCMLSRHFEREADEYAFALTGDADSLVSALKHLAKLNLANLHPHPAYAWFYYSHPPLVQRIERLERLARHQGVPAGKGG